MTHTPDQPAWVMVPSSTFNALVRAYPGDPALIGLTEDGQLASRPDQEAPEPVAWRRHDGSGIAPGIEDPVDVIGTDGLKTLGWWPHNIVWTNVAYWRPASSSPAKVEVTREEVARIIAPSAFAPIRSRTDGSPTGGLKYAARQGNRDKALTKADAILALFHPAQGGERP